MQKDTVPVDIHGPFFAELINRGNSISPRVVNFLTSFAQLITQGDIESPLFSFASWQYPIAYPTTSPLCSKSIANTQTKKAFRCFDCMEINTALLCYECFVNSNHKGHTFLEYESSGGCCDCGDSSLWNENGFCPAHTKKENKVNIPEGLKVLFVGELKLVYYLYFWCVDKGSELNEILGKFGDALFDYAGKIIQSNHETKIMMAELMSSSFQGFPQFNSIKGSILASIFHLPATIPILQKVRKFAFDMYPVEQFRAIVLREYFQLTRSGTFTWQHPIKKFNFQYLTCVRLVNTLIKEKKMLPLQIDSDKLPQETDSLVSIFKKYYEDLNYLRKMKDSKEYYQFHFELTNAIDMGLYRRFSSINKKQILFLDEYYLKTLGSILQYVLTRKDLIVRNMKELFSFVLSWKEMTCSLAQERSFAMFVVAYLQGDLMKLRNEEVAMELLSALQVKEEDAGVVLAELVAKNMRNIAILASYSHIKPEKNSYENYFYSVFPQKHFLLHLDHIYQKILFLLSKNRFDYWQVIKGTMEEIILQGEGTKIENESQHNEPSVLKREEYGKIIADLSIFFAKFFMQDLNEIVICNLLGFPRDDQIRQLNLKLISAYANKFTVKQIKLLSSYLVNNPQLFDSTLKEHTVYQNGRLKLLAPVQPIEKFIFADNLRGYRHFDELKWECVESIPTIPVLQGERVREDIVELMLANAKTIMSKIQKDGVTNYLKSALERQVLALLQIFLLTQDPQIKAYFSLNLQSLKIHMRSDISTHINSICKQRQVLLSQLQQGVRQKQDDLRRKREKVELKRKEKQAMMRKKQESMLKQYNAIEEETEQKEICIYCKEDIKQDYHLLSYVNLTNLIPKCVLKQDKLHAFISTCGHKVHQQCYTKYGEEQQQLSRCFLCKKKTNIILPSLKATPISEEEGYALAGKFLDSIFATLFAECEEKKEDIFRMFLEDEEGEGNVLRAILKSIAKEAVYYGLHLFQPYRRYSLHAYQLVYGAIRFARKDELALNLIRLQLEDLDNSHPLAILERYAYYFLRRELLAEEDEDPNLPPFDPIFLVELQKIISLIANPNQVPSVNSIQLITQQSLMRGLPEIISQLHESMGQCPYCKKLTNWIYYCLLCDWKGCNKETQAFHKHSREDHLQGSIFISAGNGKTSVVCGGLAKNQQSIYENSYGESYSHNDENTKKTNLSSFKLNFAKYQKFYEQIMTHSLHNTIQ